MEERIDNIKTILHEFDRRAANSFTENCSFMYDNNHPNDITIVTIAISPDDIHVVAGFNDKKLKLYNLEERELVHTFDNAHNSGIRAVGFTSDTENIVSVSADGKMKFWNIEKKEQLGDEIKAHEGSIDALAISVDNQFIVTGSADKSLKLWEVETRTYKHHYLDAHTQAVHSVAITEESKFIVSGSADFSIKIWNVNQPTVLATILNAHKGTINSLAITTDDRFIISSGSIDKSIRIWDVKLAIAYKENTPSGKDPEQGSQALIHQFDDAHDGTIKSIALSTDNQYILSSGSFDKSMKLWSIETKELTYHFKNAHEKDIDSVAYSNDRTFIVSSGRDKTIKQWMLSDKKAAYVMTESNTGKRVEGSLDSVAVVGNHILIGGDDGTLTRWVIDEETSVASIAYEFGAVHTESIKSVCIAGKHIFTGSADKSIKQWDFSSGKLVKHFENVHNNTVKALAVTSDSKWLISGSEDKTLKMLSIERGSHQQTFNTFGTSVEAIIIHPEDNKYIIAAFAGKEIAFYEIKQRQSIYTKANAHSVPITTLALNYEGFGYFLYSGSAEGEIIKWTVGEKELIYKMNIKAAHAGPVRGLSIALNGTLLVSSGSEDRAIKTWKIDSMGNSLELKNAVTHAHKGPIKGMAGSFALPDPKEGKYVVTVSSDKSLIVNVFTNDMQYRRRSCRKHEPFILSAAISTIGKYVICGASDNSIKLWCLETKRLLHHIPNAHEDWVNFVGVSPDDSYFFSSGYLTNTIKVYDTKFKHQKKKIKLPEDCGFLEYAIINQFTILVNTSQGYIKLFNIENTAELCSFQAHDCPIETMRLTTDGKLIYSFGSHEDYMKIWDVSKSTMVDSFIAGERGERKVASITSDCKYLLVATYDERVLNIYDIPSKKKLKAVIESPDDGIISIRLSNDNKIIFTGSQKSIKRWNLLNKNLLDSFDNVQPSSIENFEISSDQKYILSYGKLDSTAELLNIDTKQQAYIFDNEQLDCIWSVALTPDNHFVYTGYTDGSIVKWDFETKKVANSIKNAHKSWVTMLAVTPNNKYLLSGSSDCSIKMRDNSDPTKVIEEFVATGAHTGAIRSIVIHSDSKFFVSSGSLDKVVKVWSIEEKKFLFGLDNTTDGSVEGLAVSLDGNLIITGGSSDNTIKVWDKTKKSVVTKYEVAHTGSINSIVVTKDEKLFLSASSDKTIKLWSLDNNMIPVYVFKDAHTDSIQALKVSADGKIFISSSLDRSIKIWNLESKKLLHYIKEAHAHSIDSVDISSDSKYLVSSGSWDSKMKVWSLIRPQLNKVFQNNSEVQAVAISPDGIALISTSKDRERPTKLWNINTKLPLPGFTKVHEQLNTIAYTHDGKYIIGGSDSIIVWNNKTKHEVKTFHKIHYDQIEAIATSNDGKYFITGSKDKTMKLFEIQKKHIGMVHHFTGAHDDFIYAVDISSNNKYIVSGSNDKSIKIWSMESKEIIHTFEHAHHDAIKCIKISPNHKYFVSGSQDKTIKLWNLDTEELIDTFKNAHEGGVLSVAISFDSKMIVSGSDDHKVKLWSLETGHFIHQYDGHEKTVKSVAITPDGKKIISGSEDGTVRLWNVPELLIVSKDTTIYTGIRGEVHENTLILPFVWNQMHYQAIQNEVTKLSDVMEGDQAKKTDFLGNLPIDYIAYPGLEYNEYLEKKFELVRQIKEQDYGTLRKVMNSMRFDYLNILEKGSLSNPKLVKEFLDLCIYEIDEKSNTGTGISVDMKKIIVYGVPNDKFAEAEKPILTDAIQKKLTKTKTAKSYKLKYLITTMPLDLNKSSNNIKRLLVLLNSSSQRFLFEDKFILILLDYQWKIVNINQFIMFVFYSFFMLLLSIEASTTQDPRDGLRVWNQLYAIAFFLFRVFQIFLQGRSDLWINTDIVCSSFVYVTMGMLLTESRYNIAIPYLRAVYFFTGFFRWIAYLRVFSGMRSLIRTILEIFKDMGYFCVILGATILCYTFILCGFQYSDENYFIKNMYLSYQFLYNSTLADAETGLQAVSIFFPFIISVVFLNMLIAIMGDTFDKIQEKRSYSDNIERVQMILEVVYLVRKWIKLKRFFKNLINLIRFRKTNKTKYLHEKRHAALMKKIGIKKRKEEAEKRKEEKRLNKGIKVATKGSAKHALQNEKKTSSSALKMLINMKNYTSSKIKKIFKRKREHVALQERSRNIIKELRYSAKYEMFEHEPIYLVKCKLKDDDNEEEWEGKLRHLHRKNTEAIEESKKKVVKSIGTKLALLNSATGGDKVLLMEEKISGINEKMLTMKDQMSKLAKLFEQQNQGKYAVK